MLAKVKSILKKPLILGLSGMAVLIIVIVLFRRRGVVQQSKAVAGDLLAKADAVIPAL